MPHSRTADVTYSDDWFRSFAIAAASCGVGRRPYLRVFSLENRAGIDPRLLSDPLLFQMLVSGAVTFQIGELHERFHPD
jgi:hypothetical protein